MASPAPLARAVLVLLASSCTPAAIDTEPADDSAGSQGEPVTSPSPSPSPSPSRSEDARPVAAASPPSDEGAGTPAGDAVTDSAPADASRGGVDGGATSSGCAADAGHFFCEDFESGRIESAVWRVEGRPVVDQVYAASGKYALHSRITGRDQPARIGRTLPSTNEVFGRVFVYLAAERTPQTNVQFVEIGQATPFRKYAVNLWAGTVQVSSFGNDPYTHGGALAPGRLPRNRWVCIEWQFTRDAHRMTAWQDGAFLVSTAEFPAPRFERVFAGVFHFHDPAVTYDFWTDAFAVGPKRIGCKR